VNPASGCAEPEHAYDSGMATVRLERIGKQYDNGVVAVRDLSLDVADGEFVVLVGPSGCGKSTTLRMIAGLESITKGSLYIGDRRVNDVAPRDRDIAMVFQNYALYPHMTVFENLAFGLKLRKFSRPEIQARVREAAGILAIEDILDRRPEHLSGGQRQRVAVGRAIVRHPQVFLFDEPLSNLDARLRVQTRKEISRLHVRLRATMIYVTHDQVEAMTLGDRIVVMHAGEAQQIDTPLKLYERPINRFVAGFIGSPAMNFVPGRVDSDKFVSSDDALALDLPERYAATLREYRGDVVLGIRPEHVRVIDNGGAAAHARFTLDLVEPMGNEMIVYARSAATEIVARVPPGPLPPAGTPLGLTFDLDHLHFFDASSEHALGA
jgi:multiple sugar transport system ATP-binding protein